MSKVSDAFNNVHADIVALKNKTELPQIPTETDETGVTWSKTANGYEWAAGGTDISGKVDKSAYDDATHNGDAVTHIGLSGTDNSITVHGETVNVNDGTKGSRDIAIAGANGVTVALGGTEDAPSITITGPSISGQVQSDWDVTDSAAAAFIKNKPDIPDPQVNADWDVTDSASAAFIKNKPENPDQVNADWDVTDSASAAFIKNKPTIPDEQVMADWTETDSASMAFIDHKPTLATVATTGSYNDLNDKPTIPGQVQADWAETDSAASSFIDNKPTIPDAQVQTDWTETDSAVVSFLAHKPTFATVAYTGSYNDLSDKPTPTGQEQADWTETDSAAASFIAHKPTLATVATTGEYSDVLNTPDLSNFVDKTADEEISGDWMFTEPVDFGAIVLDGTSMGEVAQIKAMTAGNIEGTLTLVPDGLGGVHIQGVGAPENDTDAANKAYVDGHTPDISGKVDKLTDGSTLKFYTHTGEAQGDVDLAAVAISGSYDDLDDKPTIPDVTGKVDKSVFDDAQHDGDVVTHVGLSGSSNSIVIEGETVNVNNGDTGHTTISVAGADGVTVALGGTAAAPTMTISGNEAEVEAIQALIPSTASSTNKLTDTTQVTQLIEDAEAGLLLKAGMFIDSSTNNYNIISPDENDTHTAYALDSDYDILASAEAQHNDTPAYTYWILAESAVTGVQFFVLDKRAGLTGAYDFSAANSDWGRGAESVTSFTVEQEAALNSGATSTNIAQIATNTTDISNKVSKSGDTITGTLYMIPAPMGGTTGMVNARNTDYSTASLQGNLISFYHYPASKRASISVNAYGYFNINIANSSNIYFIPDSASGNCVIRGVNAPIYESDAATKGYVDGAIPDISGKVSKTGDTMTGALTASNGESSATLNPDGVVSAVNSSGGISLYGNSIEFVYNSGNNNTFVAGTGANTGSGNPAGGLWVWKDDNSQEFSRVPAGTSDITNDYDLTTKAYVDEAGGMSLKYTITLASSSTSNGTISEGTPAYNLGFRYYFSAASTYYFTNYPLLNPNKPWSAIFTSYGADPIDSNTIFVRGLDAYNDKGTWSATSLPSPASTSQTREYNGMQSAIVSAGTGDYGDSFSFELTRYYLTSSSSYLNVYVYIYQ